jgi:hypothetical protein
MMVATAVVVVALTAPQQRRQGRHVGADDENRRLDLRQQRHVHDADEPAHAVDAGGVDDVQLAHLPQAQRRDGRADGAHGEEQHEADLSFSVAGSGHGGGYWAEFKGHISMCKARKKRVL